MKKIIAISVMFAMLTVAAFADTSVGGQLATSVDVLHSGDDGAVAGNYDWGMYGNTNVNVSWSGENAGGKLMITPRGPQAAADGSQDQPYFAFAWWKPIDQFRFQIGYNGDGDLGHAQIVGWGFTGEAKPAGAAVGYDFDYDPKKPEDGGAVTSDYKVENNPGFWGGFTGPGLLLSIYPIEGFEIDFGIPYKGNYGTDKAAVVYSNTKINLKYDIADIGTARVAFDLNKASEDADLLPGVYLAFYLSAIENIGAEIGVALTPDGEGNAAKVIDLGIGFKYTADDFGVKAGIGVGVKNGDADDKPLRVTLLPYYNLGSLTAYLNVGFGTILGTDNDAIKGVDIFFNPYVKVPVNAGNFYAGIKFKQGAGKPKPDAEWSVPIGWQVYF